MRGRQSGSWTATSYEGLPRDDLVAKIKPDTLDNSYCRSIYTPQRTYWIMFDSSAKNALIKNDEKTDVWKRHSGHQCTTALFHLVTQKAKMHGNDTTVFNTQRHCSMLEVRLHANIPWSPPASTRNVDCWPPHH